MAQSIKNLWRRLMKLRTFAAAMAALTMSASPVLAQTTQSAPISNSVFRAAASTDEESNAERNRGTGVILGILAAAAIIGGIVVAAGNKDDAPASP